MLVNAIPNEAKTGDLSPFYNLTFGPTTSVTCKPQRAEEMVRDMAQLLKKGFTVNATLWLIRPCPSTSVFSNCYIRKLKHHICLYNLFLIVNPIFA